MKAYAPGIYPRSDALVQATRDFDRGRVSAADVERQCAADLQTLIAVESEAGFDLLADGMLAWQDLFRPLVDASEGLRPAASRADTNTFFRAPHAAGRRGCLSRSAPTRSPTSTGRVS